MEPDRTPVTQAELDAAQRLLDQSAPTGGVDAVGIPEDGDDEPDEEPEPFTGGRGWTPGRKDGIETFTAPDGRVFVRARPDEDADVIVSFTTRGLLPMRLVLSSGSSTVRRAERKARREARELRKRGYEV